MEPGIYLAHKAVGSTSFEVVRAYMAEAAATRPGKFPICHGGTLDPFAEGLLLLLTGQATRLMEFLHSVPKEYEAQVSWGVETDACDHLGRPVFQGDPSGLTRAALDAALEGFLGWRDQVPPKTSAKKIDGEPAYKKAHRGEEFEMPPSRVFLYQARWLSHDLPRASRLGISCRGGYYVRALARDLGRVLGCGAHLSGLRRTAIGPWSDPGPDRRVLVQGEGLLPWCPSRPLSETDADALKHGRAIARGEVLAPSWPVPAGFPDPEGPLRGLHRGKLVALLREQEGQLASFANLRGGL